MFNEPPAGGLIKHLMSSYNANKIEKVEQSSNQTTQGDKNGTANRK